MSQALGFQPAALSRIAAGLYPRGPLLFRLLQRYRPYICPFEDLIEHVPVGASVLDIGCGGGLFVGLLAATGRRPAAIGFDVSAPAIDLARSMTPPDGNPEVRFLRLDADAAWPEGPFDVVSMIDVLHHVPPKAQEDVIRRACRAVAGGGTFLFKDMGARPLWRAAANRLHDLLLARQWIHYAPIREVERWAKEEGLELRASRRINRLWYGHDLRVFRRP